MTSPPIRVNQVDNIPKFFDSQSETMRIAAQAALAAGEIIKNGYQKVHQIDSKGIGDLVSDVDFNADKAGTEILNSLTSFPIMSEELSPEVDDTNQKMWVFDPLDGTTAYLMGAGPHFSSVLLALCDQGKPVLGITYFPMTGEWFYAEKGLGAWNNGESFSIKPREYSLGTSWIEMNQYGDVNYETDFFRTTKKALRSPGGATIATSTFPHAGVAMRVAEQGSGLSAAIHDNNPSSLKQGPWDIAANQIIFQEAGGYFFNPDLEQTSPFVAEPIIISPTRELAKEIVDCVAAFQETEPVLQDQQANIA